MIQFIHTLTQLQQWKKVSQIIDDMVVFRWYRLYRFVDDFSSIYSPSFLKINPWISYLIIRKILFKTLYIFLFLNLSPSEGPTDFTLQDPDKESDEK